MSVMERVPYLEDEDFNPDHSLKKYVNKGKPCVVMVQANFCGYCTQAKPAFQKVAHSLSEVVCSTIQADGGPSDNKASKRVPKLDKSYTGYPTYMGFSSSGKFIGVHNGGRDEESLKKFALSLN